MKENLELVEHKNITSFNFSANNPYEKVVIGQGPYRSGSGMFSLLPNFVGLKSNKKNLRNNQDNLSVNTFQEKHYMYSDNNIFYVWSIAIREILLSFQAMKPYLQWEKKAQRNSVKPMLTNGTEPF